MSALLKKYLSWLGERDVAVVALQQPFTDNLFQLPDGATQRRLRHVEPLRSLTEMQQLGDGEIGAQVTHIDAHSNAFKVSIIR